MVIYAVIEAAGKQYKVSPGQKVQVDHMSVEPGETVEFDKVLVVGDDGNTVIGTPTVKGAKVVAESLGEEKGDKVIVFRYKRKTRYRRKTGHRQLYTTLGIKQIITGKTGRKRKSKVTA